MPTLTSNDQLLDAIRKSHLLSQVRLDAFLEEAYARPEPPGTPSDMATLLVRQGLLTQFQCTQLLQGKFRGFYVQNKYKVLKLLGSGGSGNVFLCQQTKLSRLVALKILPTSQLKNSVTLERFYREGRAIASLDHPNIVRVHDIDNVGQMHFMVLEYVDGVSFQDLVRKVGPLPIGRAAQLIQQAAVGLEHAHAHGWCHRDVKPANLLLDRTGTVKLLDLGLARFFEGENDGLTKCNPDTLMGTIDYISPEQALSGHDVDIRADLYCLGGTLFYLLTGKPPFPSTNFTQTLLQHQLEEPIPISRERLDVPEGLADVLRKMMAKKRENRYQTPAEVYHALAPWAGPVERPEPSELPLPLAPSLISDSPTQGPQSTELSPTPTTRQHLPPLGAPPARMGAPPTPSGGELPDQTDSEVLRSTSLDLNAGNDTVVFQWRGATIATGDSAPTSRSAVQWDSVASKLKSNLASVSPIVWVLIGSGWALAIGLVAALALLKG